MLFQSPNPKVQKGETPAPKIPLLFNPPTSKSFSVSFGSRSSSRRVKDSNRFFLLLLFVSFPVMSKVYVGSVSVIRCCRVLGRFSCYEGEVGLIIVLFTYCAAI